MKIYLIRHAETVHNVGQAWYRPPFTYFAAYSQDTAIH
jgi:broad specificity phosphatase PhoE